MPAHYLAGRLHRIVGEVSIARGCCGLGVAELEEGHAGEAETIPQGVKHTLNWDSDALAPPNARGMLC